MNDKLTKRKQKSNKVSKIDDSTIVLIVFIIIFVVVYLITLGKVDISDNKENSVDQKREKAKERHILLVKRLEEKQKTKEKIEKNKKKIYFFIRLIAFLSWIIINFLFYHFQIVKDLRELLFYNQLILILIISLIFVFVGSYTNMKDIISYLKNTIENRLYSTRLNELRTDIDMLEQEKVSIETEHKIIPAHNTQP